MSITLCVLGSGSKGNAIYIKCADTSLLVDAGLSARQIGQRLNSIGVKLTDLNALLITHEHRDHLSGVRVLSKQHPLPVYFNKATWAAGYPKLGTDVKQKIFNNGEPFKIGNLTVEAFSISHDSADPVGFIIHSEKNKVAIATDLGYASNLVKEKCKGAHLMVLESNHDMEMLKNGPYPWVLKQRVWGRQGHLSNEDSGLLLKELYHSGLQHVVLAHVSEVNNSHDLVSQSAQKSLKECALHEVAYSVAPQHHPGEKIHLI